MADTVTAHHVLVRRLRQGELLALDCLAAIALSVLLYLGLPGSGQASTPLRLALVAGIALPIALRRLWPVPVFAVVTATSVLAALFDVLREPFLGVAYALYWVAVVTPRTRWVPTAKIGLASVVVLVGGLLMGSSAQGVNGLFVHVTGLALAGMAWTVGQSVQERRAYAVQSAQQLATRAVAEERLRIARELHDIVAHHIGVITVKAGVANYVLASRPQEAGDALRVIETASRTALAEMRYMLGVLRSGGSADETPDLRPAQGLAALPELVERAATAGVALDVHTRNTDGLPEGVDRSAYRIVLEALTNVMKHAAPTRCHVDVEADGDELRIDVLDEGIGSTVPHREGHGLIGMRERVALYGGVLRTGPRPEGGFAVSARLPYSAVGKPGE